LSAQIDNYLRKRGVKGPWGLSPIPNYKFQNIVIIPAYAELQHIGQTLDSLSQCEVDSFDNIMVVVVVNNEPDAPPHIIVNNQQTLLNLKKRDDPFYIAVIDASSEGVSISKKHAGVGIARKIGMDLALKFAFPHSLLYCLDADSLVAPTYFREIQAHFNSTESVAAVVGFSHIKNENPELEIAIRQYEAFLRMTAMKLKDAGSPFGYVAMGSTIICRAHAYASIGGMPRRKATEDFYFLQEFAKFRGVTEIEAILVYPSSRESERVYLGTGFRISQAKKGEDLGKLAYPNEAFKILKEWLTIVSSAYSEDINKILTTVQKLNPLLHDYLLEENINEIWNPLRESSPSEAHFQKQFHRWFDALKTHRLLNQYLTISSLL
jgi:glycosyltransferase involved in cell wall biosynthesis